MGIVIDGIIAAIICLSTYIGYKRGLIKVIFSILSFFIAIILTFTLYRPVTAQISEKTNLDEQIETKIEEKLEEAEGEDKENFSKYIDNLVKDSKDKTNKEIAKTVSTVAVEAISFVVVFLVIKIILTSLGIIFNLVSTMPIIKQFNKSGGLIYGILLGVVLVYIIFAIIYFVIPLTKNMEILKYIDSSYLGKIFYNDNLIIKQLVK